LSSALDKDAAPFALPRPIRNDERPEDAVRMVLEAFHRRYPNEAWLLNGRPVLLEGGETKPLSFATFRSMLASAAELVVPPKKKDEGHILTYIPQRMAADAYSARAAFPRLAGVVHCPWVDANGRLVSEPGYDEASQTWLHWDDEPVDPEQVTDADVMEILERLLDFRFAGDVDRLRYLALLFRVVRGPASWGHPNPLTIVYAENESSGKSLAVMLAIAIAGSNDGESQMPHEREMEYKLPALLRNSPTFLWFDNAKTGSLVGGEHLQAALTSENGSRNRAVGTSDLICYDARRSIFVVTINQPDIDNETNRRTIAIALKPPPPGHRWRTPGLLSWARQPSNRARVIAVLCRLLLDWHRDGCLPPPTLVDSFDTWSRLCGGPACRVLGDAGWLARESNLAPSWEQDLDQLIALGRWPSKGGSYTPLRPGLLLVLADLHDHVHLSGVAGAGNERSRQTTFGKHLHAFSRRGKPTPAGWLLCSGEAKDGRLYWPKPCGSRGPKSPSQGRRLDSASEACSPRGPLSKEGGGPRNTGLAEPGELLTPPRLTYAHPPARGGVGVDVPPGLANSADPVGPTPAFAGGTSPPAAADVDEFPPALAAEDGWIPHAPLSVAGDPFEREISALAAAGIRINPERWQEVGSALIRELELEQAVCPSEETQGRLRSLAAYFQPILAQAYSGRVKSTWVLQGTGRLSAIRPPLQTITKQRGLRSAIEAEPGKVFVIADWTSAHMWVAAGISGDAAFLTEVNGGSYLKLGREWAPGVPEDQAREIGKILALATINGAGGQRLTDICGAHGGPRVHKGEARRRRDQWLSRFQALKTTMERLTRESSWRTPLGRTVVMPAVPWAGAALGWRWQSIEADALRLVLRGAEKDGIPAVLTLHDEVLFEVEEARANDVLHHVKWLMDTSLGAAAGIERLAERRYDDREIAVKARWSRTWGER